MPARSKVLTKDEELGKRDDDFRPARSRSSAMSGLSPWHWRRRRLLLAVVLVGIVYVFVLRIPASATLDGDNPAYSGWYGRQNIHPTYSSGSGSPAEPKGAPQRDGDIGDDERTKHYYNGPIKFFKLGDSLRSLPPTLGNMATTRNILFAASSLKSLANLLPMACEMAKQDQVRAHVALFGRSTLSIQELLEINGVDNTTCSAYFHDAREDFAEYSSDFRAEVSVAGAMAHINNYMHPQALIVDDRSLEDRFFTDAMTQKAKEIDRPLIEIPKGRYANFLWMTRLDAGGLSSWHTPTVDIVIQAPHGSAGSLIRLLKSLAYADYGAIRVPRLTIELPTTPEASMVKFLAGFRWPPGQDKSSRSSSLLNVRHKIPSSNITPEYASIRFLESFYPTDPYNHHTLILSPQAQVDPQFMHLLHYLILKYRHSSYGMAGSERLVGLSLETRSNTVNGTKFGAPTTADSLSWKYRQDSTSDQDTPISFLYQAPSSGAILIFGDRWVTLHSFLANRLAATHLGKARRVEKLVPRTEPAWMEYLLELMRARGWSIMHPASSFVTLHNELAQIPEEFLPQSNDTDHTHVEQPNTSDHAKEEAFLAVHAPPVLDEHKEYDLSQNFGPLHQILPLKGVLPDLFEMPSYSHEGVPLNNLEIDSASEFTAYFRTNIGGCTSKEADPFRQSDQSDTNDLFCLPGMDVEPSEDSSVSDYFGDDGYASESAQLAADSEETEVDDLDSNDPSSEPVYQAASPVNAEIQDETEADLAHGVP